MVGLAGQYVGHLGVFWWVSRRKEYPDLGFTVQGSDALFLGIGLLLQLVLAILFLPLSRYLFPDGDSAQQVGMPWPVWSRLLPACLRWRWPWCLAPVTEELIFRASCSKRWGTGAGE